MLNIIEKIEKIRIWQLLILLVILGSMSAWALRQNNLEMLILRDKVVAADIETGDIAKIAPYIEDLGSYVLGHMNASLGAPLELPGTYNIAVEEARKKVEQSGTANSAVYASAQTVCEQPNVLLTVRAQCIQDYVTTNAVPGTDVEELVFPPKELFSYSFISPLWSADFAGLSVLATAVAGLWVLTLIGVRVVAPRVNNWILKDPLE